MESRSGLGGKSVVDTTAVAGTLAQRNKRAPGGKPRVWGMLFYVVDTVTPANSTLYQLKYGNVNTNINDNANWAVFTAGGGSSASLLRQGFETDGVTTVFTVTAGTLQQIIAIFYNGVYADPETYNVAGQDIDFTVAPPASPDGTNNLFVVFAEDVTLTEDFLESVAADTTGATITLDGVDQKQRIFTGSNIIAANKAVAFNNDANLLVFVFHVNVTGAQILTFPSDFVAQTNESRWNNATKQLLLTGAVGTPFEISGTFDGSLWKLKISADFYDA